MTGSSAAEKKTINAVYPGVIDSPAPFDRLRACSRRIDSAGTCGRQIKPIEFRSRPTKIIGERFYIYASQRWAAGKLFLNGCRVPGENRGQG